MSEPKAYAGPEDPHNDWDPFIQYSLWDTKHRPEINIFKFERPPPHFKFKCSDCTDPNSECALPPAFKKCTESVLGDWNNLLEGGPIPKAKFYLSKAKQEEKKIAMGEGGTDEQIEAFHSWEQKARPIIVGPHHAPCPPLLARILPPPLLSATPPCAQVARHDAAL